MNANKKHRKGVNFLKCKARLMLGKDITMELDEVFLGKLYFRRDPLPLD